MISRAFSPNYATVRRRFLELLTERGGRLDSLPLSASGPAGEKLAIDIGWFGCARPRRVLVHSSGLHGVEAFAGSAIQLQWLEEAVPALPEDAAVVIVHVLNPYGMAWLRRFNENNVDLNRNYLASEEQYAGAPARYELLAQFLNPASLPARDLFYLRAAGLVARYGIRALQQAISGGQYTCPAGLFFGGAQLEEGSAKFQDYMAESLGNAERIVTIDVHTGLGRFGDDRLLVDTSPGRMALSQTMRAVFGQRVELPDMQSVACEVRGGHYNMYYRLFPTATVYSAAQELGTYHPLRVVEALRAENRWHHYGGGAIDHPAKRRLLEVFNPDSPRWRDQVLQRGSRIIRQAAELAFE